MSIRVRPKDGEEESIEVPGSQDDHLKLPAEQAFAQDVVPNVPPPVASGAEGISFGPGVAPHIASALSRLHQNMGHPSAKDLTRHLRYAGADNAVLKASKTLKCQTCQRCQRTSDPRPASLPSLLEFNQVVSLDVFHVFDANRVRHELLSIIDHSTTYHQVRRITGHSSEDFENGFVEAWGRVFGPPKTLFADLHGDGIASGPWKVRRVLWDTFTSSCRPGPLASGHSRETRAVVSRDTVPSHRGAVRDHRPRDGCCSGSARGAKNELRRKHGYSPTMAVFGREPRYPEELEGGHDDELYLEIVSADRQRQREVAIRTSARVAFFQTRQDDKLRRALLQRSRVKRPGGRRWQLLDQLRGPMPSGGK